MPEESNSVHGGLGSSGLTPASFDAISFAVIGTMWINHHGCSRRSAVDHTVLVANLALLLVISFIPFPTELGGGLDLSGDKREAFDFARMIAPPDSARGIPGS